MKRLFSGLTALILLLPSCGPAEQPKPNENTDPQGGTEGVGVTAVSVNPKSLTLSVGKTAQLEAIITPENAENPTVVWKSSDEGVVTVSKGLVTAIADGKATVTATSVDNPAAKASCEVSVSTVYVTSISFLEPNPVIVVDNTYQLNPVIEPDDAANAAIGYKVVSGSAVTVDDNGLVTALSTGSGTVRATALDGKGAQAEVQFTVVNEPIYATGFSIQCDKEIEKGKTVTGKIVCEPSGTNMKDFLISTSDASVAKVINNAGDTFTLQGLKAGSAMITVHYNSKAGVSDLAFTLYVHDGPPSIAWTCGWETDEVGYLDGHGMVPGETYTMAAAVTNLHNTSVVYEIVSGSNYASITGSVLKATAPGKIQVRARSVANPSLVTPTVFITVHEKAEKLSFYDLSKPTVWEGGDAIYIRQNSEKTTIRFQVTNASGAASRQCVTASVSSNLSAYVTPTVRNYTDFKFLDIDFAAKPSSSVVKGTLTLRVPGTSLSKTFNLNLCLYEADDIKPGDAVTVSINGRIFIYDGFWRGGDLWYSNKRYVQTSVATGKNKLCAIVAWTGTPGETDSYLHSIASWQTNAKSTHGYAIAISDAYSNTSDSKARWSGDYREDMVKEYGDPSKSNVFRDGATHSGGHYRGCPVAPDKDGKYGYDMTKGLLAFNYDKGDSYHVTVLHHLYKCDRGWDEGNSGFTAYNTTFELLPEDLSPKTNANAWYTWYSSGWFLPSSSEWYTCLRTLGMDRLNEYFGQVSGGTLLESSALYWTPQQSSDGKKAKTVTGLGNPGDYLDKKSGRARTRAIMAF